MEKDPSTLYFNVNNPLFHFQVIQNSQENQPAQ